MNLVEAAGIEAEESVLPSKSLESLIGTLATMMANRVIGAGDLADLRRLDIPAPDRPIFWRLLSGCIASDRTLSDAEESRWAMILSGMARLPHSRGRRLGETLAEADYSEGRLMKLLRTEGVNLAPLVRRTCIFLASKGQEVDWVDFAQFILATDPEKREAIRRRIARNYYAVKAKKEKSS
jgi:CRISPR system Cascade subunit CasB